MAVECAYNAGILPVQYAVGMHNVGTMLVQYQQDDAWYDAGMTWDDPDIPLGTLWTPRAGITLV